MVVTVLLAQPAETPSSRTSSIRVLGPVHSASITRHSLALRVTDVLSMHLASFWLTFVIQF